MVAATTLLRFVEGLGTGARVDEKGVGGVDRRVLAPGSESSIQLMVSVRKCNARRR